MKITLISTIILGDSNTKYLSFGTGVGTFGQSVPGKRTAAFVTDQIDPKSCIGYPNIVVHVVINDLKDRPGQNVCVWE